MPSDDRPIQSEPTKVSDQALALSELLEREGPTSPPVGRQVHDLLPLIIKVLDRLDSDELTPEQRVRSLHHLKRPLLTLVGGLPRPPRPGVGTNVAAMPSGLTLAQRLFERTCRNLDRILIALDRRRFSPGDRDADYRWWTIRQLFKFIGYQVDYAIIWNRPWPEHTWQRLHDLFGYLIQRGDVQLGHPAPVAHSTFEPETLYKRLLLLSLAPQLSDKSALTVDILDHLEHWAKHSRLVDPSARLGQFGVLVVETSEDAPARQRIQPAEAAWRGWALDVPRAFLDSLGVEQTTMSLSGEEGQTPGTYGAYENRRFAG